MRVVILALVLLAGAFGTARAQDIFTVPRVPVFAEAENAARAQEIAQEQGRRTAMDILLRRLTAQDDWDYLPRLAAGQAAPAGGGFNEPYDDALAADGFGTDLALKQAVLLAPSDLTRLEVSFAPDEEKTSRTTYRASVTYRFKPDAVRRLLQDARLPYSESQSRTALVLPVLETEEGLYLWEAKNPWARAWLSRPFTSELTPLILPRGDERDVQTITAEQAHDLDARNLATLAGRYGAGQVVLALGRLTEEGGEQRLSVRLLDAWLDGRGSTRRRIDASNSSQLYDARPGAGEPGQVLEEGFYRAQSGDFPALAKRAVESTVSDYAADWKARTLVDHAAVRSFRLTAWFTTLDEWAEIRSALESTALVREMKTGAFNNENAVIDLTAIGEPQQFALAMRQEGLTVWDGQGGWNIAVAEHAADVQAREAAMPERDETRRRRLNLPGFGGRDRVGAGVPAGELPELPDDLFGEPGEGPETLEPDAPEASSNEASEDDDAPFDPFGTY